MHKALLPIARGAARSTCAARRSTYADCTQARATSSLPEQAGELCFSALLRGSDALSALREGDAREPRMSFFAR